MTRDQARSAYLSFIRNGVITSLGMRNSLERLCEPDDDFRAECKKAWEFHDWNHNRIKEQNRKDYERYMKPLADLLATSRRSAGGTHPQPETATEGP